MDLSIWAFLLGGIQVAGLASGCLARASVGTRWQHGLQWLFLACLVSVGMAALVSVTLFTGGSVPCWITLALMVLTAICDFRQSQPSWAK